MLSKNYIAKRVFKDFVLFNIFINGLFYILTFKNFEGTLYLESIQKDLFIGLLILGIFCTYAGFVMTWKDAITGSYYNYKPSKIYQIIPKNMVLRIILGVVLACGIIFPLCIFIPSLLGVSEISHVFGFLMKVGSAIVASAIIGYIVILVSIGDYHNLSSNNKSLEKRYSI